MNITPHNEGVEPCFSYFLPEEWTPKYISETLGFTPNHLTQAGRAWHFSVDGKNCAIYEYGKGHGNWRAFDPHSLLSSIFNMNQGTTP